MTEDAWDRLRRWRATRSTDADAALEALAAVGELRRTLDQCELAAVRAARRQGRSWTEIATQLGITRQSAWEKWRDLDQDADDAERAAAAATVDEVARERRRRGAVDVPVRRSKVTVPDVIGRGWQEARALLWDVELVALNADPDAPPIADESGWLVTDQTPESGARVPAGTIVRLWVRRSGGGAGVREPRAPLPRTGSGRGMRPEPTERALG